LDFMNVDDPVHQSIQVSAKRNSPS
jgi:hypothetical protein